MAYNPTVNDLSGIIVGQSQANAANTQLGGMESLAQGLGGAAQSMAHGITGASMTKQELDMLDGFASALSDQGAVDQEWLDKFGEASLGKKRGLINMAHLNWLNQQKQDYMMAQMMQAKDLAEFKAQVGVQYSQEKPGRAPVQFGNVNYDYIE